MEILKNPNYDFLGKAKYFIGLSIAFILLGVGIILTPSRGLHYGVEFSGGTELIVQFQKPPETDKIRQVADKVSPGAVIQTYGDPKQNKVLIRLGGHEAAEGEIDTKAPQVRDGLAASYPQNPVTEFSSEVVGAVVGSELRQKAIQLTVLGLLFQLIYIAIRFKGGVWGAAAVMASIHDVLICLGFLALFNFEITLNVIAALLTLVGYSVNDTIVVFDRVRENLRLHRKDPLPKVLNDSINQTLTRTLISNGTTFLAVLGLYLFGGEVLRGFGFTMVVGILVGTYSTVFIAAPVVEWWSRWSEARHKPGAKAA
jgi:preprotein translocase subunit SecF